MNTLIKLGWVRPAKIEELKGISKGAIDKMKQRGKLKEGYHFKMWNNRIFYHFERIDELIDEAA